MCFSDSLNGQNDPLVWQFVLIGNENKCTYYFYVEIPDWPGPDIYL